MIQIKPDNLYDILFNNEGNPKDNSSKKMVISGEKLDFLENQGSNV